MADFIAYCINANGCGRSDLRQFYDELYEMRFRSAIVNTDEKGREYVTGGIYKMQKGTGEP